MQWYTLYNEDGTVVPPRPGSRLSHYLGTALEAIMADTQSAVVTRKGLRYTIEGGGRKMDLSVSEPVLGSGKGPSPIVKRPPGMPPVDGWYTRRALKYTIPPTLKKVGADVITVVGVNREWKLVVGEELVKLPPTFSGDVMKHIIPLVPTSSVTKHPGVVAIFAYFGKDPVGVMFI